MLPVLEVFIPSMGRKTKYCISNNNNNNIYLLFDYNSKIKIGQIVACNSYRNPALLAKMISTLDLISNGRVELGIGAGWYEHEFRACNNVRSYCQKTLFLSIIAKGSFLIKLKINYPCFLLLLPCFPLLS